MRRDGFVVEVKRRRFPRHSATNDLDGAASSGVNSLGLSCFSGAPFVEGERSPDRTIEAAKIAAERFFNEPRSPQSAEAIDPTAHQFVGHIEAVGAADVAPHQTAGDLVASPSAQPYAQPEKPRSGRILQSLIVEDPIDALLRREAEERLARRRRRGPRVQGEPAKSGTGFMELPVLTDVAEPTHKSGSRTVVTEPKPVVDSPRRKTAKKKGAKAPGRVGSRRRPRSEKVGDRRQAQKRAAGKSPGKQRGIAKKSAAKQGTSRRAGGKKAILRKSQSVGTAAARKQRGR